MKETGIIMSGNHPRLILDELKTMTRRTYGLDKINKGLLHLDWQAKQYYGNVWTFKSSIGFTDIKCPYGGIGDRLWVRETFDYIFGDEGDYLIYKADKESAEWFKQRKAEGSEITWKPSIHMSRKDSRAVLEITGLRAERVQEITEEDAKAEGTNPFLLDKLKGGTKYKMLQTYHHEAYPLISHADEGETVIFECPNMGYARLHHTQWKEKQDYVFRIPVQEVFEYVGALEPDYKNGFRILWDSLNAKRGYGWEVNPWVWVISFKVVE